MARPRLPRPVTPKTTLRAEVRELRAEVLRLRLDQRQILEVLRELREQGHKLPELLRNAAAVGLAPLPATVTRIEVPPATPVVVIYEGVDGQGVDGQAVEAPLA